VLAEAVQLRLDSGNTIQVATDRGALVLRGIVNDDHERRLAEAIARLTPGVHELVRGAALRLGGGRAHPEGNRAGEDDHGTTDNRATFPADRTIAATYFCERSIVCRQERRRKPTHGPATQHANT